MITAITNDNINLFEHLIPDDLIEDLLIRNDTYGLGCIRRDTDGNFDGFGVLLFVKEFDGEVVENYHIKWLYVDSSRRGVGIGCELITDLYWDFGNTEVPTMTVDIPAMEEYEKLGNFLGDWHFQFLPTYTVDFEMPIAELKKNKYFSSVAKDTVIDGVVSLKGVEEKAIKKFLRELRKKYIKRGLYVDIMLTEYSKDYFDPEISSAIVKNGIVDGAMLVHTRPSGRYEIIVFDTLLDNQKMNLLKLMDKTYQAALKANKKNATVYHKCYNERGMDFIDDLFGTHETPYVLRGMIENSSVALSSEEWEEIKEEYWKDNPDLYEDVKAIVTGNY